MNIKNILFHTSSYTTINIVEKLLPFLILPILTRLLDKNEIGYFILYQAILEIVYPIITKSIDSSILINYFKIDLVKFKEYVSTGLYTFGLLYIFYIVLVLVFDKYIINHLEIQSQLLYLVIFIIPFRFAFQLKQNLWQINKNIKEYAYYTIIFSLLKNIGGLFIVLYVIDSYLGLIYMHLISYIIMAIIGLYILIKNKYFKIVYIKVYVVDALKVGIPITVHLIGMWFSNAVNKIILNREIDSVATANYGIASTFSLGLAMIEDAINKAYIPHLFEELKKSNNETKLNIKKVNVYLYSIILLLTIIIIFISYNFIGIIYGVEYLSVKSILIPLLLAAMFKGFYKIHVNYLFFYKKTHLLSGISIFVGLINVTLAIYLIPQYGIFGASISILLSSIIQYLMTLVISNRILKTELIS